MTILEAGRSAGDGEGGMVVSRGIEVVDWLPEELEAFRQPELIPTIEWVEKHVRIPEKGAAVPGPFRREVTPWCVGVFDAWDRPEIETMTIVTGTQLGKSTVLYSGVMANMCQKPGPRLLVMPTEPDAREVAGVSLKDLAGECEVFLDLAVGGEPSLTREMYELRTGNLYFGWSNSAASLARRSCREVVYDEADKFPPYVGQETDPISLGDKRLRTFRNTTGAKSVRISTPTTRDGLIWQAFEESDQRFFWIACRGCGEYQKLVWQNVVWPHGADGHSVPREEIETEQLARYKCQHCGRLWTDYEKNEQQQHGVWARLGERVEPDGRVTGEAEKPGNHAGFHLSALYSTFTTLSQLASAFLRAKDNPILLQDFLNAELGVIFEERESSTEIEDLRKRIGGHKRAILEPVGGRVTGELPPGVLAITCFVDVQHGSFYTACRGWGYGLESWVLDYRQLVSEQALFDYLREVRFTRLVERPDGTAKKIELGIRLTLIDSGDQTSYVYGLVDRWRDIDIRPTKGEASNTGALWKISHRRKDPRTGKAYSGDVRLYTVNTDYFKDLAALLISVPEAGPGFMHLPDDVDHEYLMQVTSEYKVVDRKRGKAGRSARKPPKIWKMRAGRSRNHYWDCEVGNVIAAEMLGVRAARPPSEEREKTTKDTKGTKSDKWKASRF